MALRLSLGLSFVAALAYALHLAGAITIGYASEWAAAGAFGWLVVNAGLVWIAMRRIRSLRFAAERRSAVRFAVDVPGWIDGQPATVHDVSVGGALVALAEPMVEREAHLVTFDLPTGSASLWANVRSSRQAASGEQHYALEFEPGQYSSRAFLTREVFAGRYPVAGTVRHGWAELLKRELTGLSRRFRMRESALQEHHGAPILPGVELPSASA